MKTYYMDNTARAYKKELVVIGEAAFRKIQDNCLEGWMHHWISGEFNSLKEAKEYYKNEWMK